MKEENKYYQPSIEEFCVGFEFEFQDIEYAQWISDIYKLNWTVEDSGIEEYLDWGNVRVKYLDSQDIIDCGFIKVANNPARQKFVNELSFEANDCRIELFPYIEGIPEQLRGIVNIITTLNYGGCLKFHGKIKNKHELQTILKQIGVL